MRTILSWMIISLALAGSVFGQALTSLNGTVTDQSGAIVAGVNLTITNVDTGGRRTAQSDSFGRYLFAQVLPGTYKLSTQKQGFREAVVNDLKLEVNLPSTLDLRLEVGAVTESISVQAEAVRVNTTDASIGNVITMTSVLQLPSFARNVAGLLALQPGVTFFGDTGDFRSGSVNGGKSDQSNITLDGIDVNNQASRFAFSPVLRSTPDSVQEFRSTTLNATADQGRSSGAQVNMVTRSGGNELHGALYDYHRNTKTAANSFFRNQSGVAKPALLIDVFGGRAGGPLIRNRTFLFGNFEQRRDRSSGEGVRIVPSNDLRNGIVSYLDTNRNIKKIGPADVQRIDPAGIGVNQQVLALFKSFPEANDFTQGDQLNRQGYRFTAPVRDRQNTYIAKLDHYIDASNKHSVFIRGNLQNDRRGSLPQFPGDAPNSVNLSNSKGLGAGYNAVLSSNFISTFRWGYTRQGNETSGLQNASYVTFRNFTDRVAQVNSTVALIPVHHITQDFNWTKGSHTFQFGGVLRYIQNGQANDNNTTHIGTTNVSWLRGTGAEFYNGVPDLNSAFTTSFGDAMMALTGVVSQVNSRYNYRADGSVQPIGAPVARNFKGEEYEMYVMDTWRVSRALTVTAGLRYSLMPPVYERDGLQTTAAPRLNDWFNLRGALADQGKSQLEAGRITFHLANSPQGRDLYPFHKKNFAPRFALAYSPQSSDGFGKFLFGGPGKTSIRAGWGMFYDLFGQGVMGIVAANAFGFRTNLQNSSGTQTLLTAPRFTGLYNVPANLLQPAPPGGFPTTYPDLRSIVSGGLDDSLQQPYSMSMNFSIGREFGGGWFVEGSYVGRLSRKSLIQRDMAMPTNLRDPATGTTYWEAAKQLVLARRAGVATANLARIPFFENMFPGAAGGGLTATQAVYNSFRGYPNDEISALFDMDYFDDPSFTRLGRYSIFAPQYSALAAWSSIAGGSFHAMQWTVQKRMTGYTIGANYTWGKSIDLASQPERAGGFSGFLVNSWSPFLNRSVSDFDITHNFNLNGVWELPFGKGRSFGSGAHPALDAIIGGWQISGIWRWTSGFTTSAGTGRVWPTNWNITSAATIVGAPPATKDTKNAPAVAGIGGPNIFADPRVAVSSFTFTFPGEVGNRNPIRGDGLFNIDLGLAKRFVMPYSEKHSIQFRAEAFNVSNSVSFDARGNNMSLGDLPNFGKYTGTINDPRQVQFALRYEF